MAQPEINQQLTRQGWTFLTNHEPTAEMMGKAVWAYKPVHADAAAAWCVLYYAPATPGRILYNGFGNELMRKIQKRIKRNNMLVLEQGRQLSGVASLESYADFADTNYVMRVLTYQNPGSFGIKIFGRGDYLQAKENNKL